MLECPCTTGRVHLPLWNRNITYIAEHVGAVESDDVWMICAHRPLDKDIASSLPRCIFRIHADNKRILKSGWTLDVSTASKCNYMVCPKREYHAKADLLIPGILLWSDSVRPSFLMGNWHRFMFSYLSLWSPYPRLSVLTISTVYHHHSYRPPWSP